MFATLRRPAAALAVLAAAGTIAVSGAQSATAGAPPKPAPSRAASTVMQECLPGNLTQRPRAFTLTCADANLRLDQMTWRNWGTKAARGTGVVTLNTCAPDCARGTMRNYPVKVVADRLVPLTTPTAKGKAYTQTYTRLTVRYTGTVPASSPRVEVFRLPR